MKVPVHASSSACVCAHTGNMSTLVHDHMCACELVCIPITVCVSPSWVCKQVGLPVFMRVYEYMTNGQHVCAGDTIPVCACVRACLFAHVVLCLCRCVWDREDMRGCREGPAGRGLQRCRDGRCGDPFCELSRSF